MNWKDKLLPVKGSVFDKPKYQSVEPRQRFLDNVKAQFALFNGTGTNVKQKQTWTHNEDTDKYRLTFKFGNTSVKVKDGGEDDEGAYVVAFEDAKDVFEGVLAEAEAGAFDEQLNRLSREFAANLSAAREKAKQKQTA